MRSEGEILRGVRIPGLSTGDMCFCRFSLELDGQDLLELGTHRDGYPLRFVNRVEDDVLELKDMQFPAHSPSCIGERIEDVLVAKVDESIFLSLSGRRYLWVEDDVDGSVLYLEGQERFASGDEGSAVQMVEYWGDIETDYGGA